MTAIIDQQLQDAERYLQPMRYADARAHMKESANDNDGLPYPYLIHTCENLAALDIVGRYCQGDDWRDQATVQGSIVIQREMLKRMEDAHGRRD